VLKILHNKDYATLQLRETMTILCWLWTGTKMVWSKLYGQ